MPAPTPAHSIATTHCAQFRVLRQKGTEPPGVGECAARQLATQTRGFLPLMAWKWTAALTHEPPHMRCVLLLYNAGKYNKHKDTGVYHCAGCDAPLYE